MLVDALKREYFLGNGKKVLCAEGPSEIDPDNYKTTFICSEEDLGKLGEIHFVFETENQGDNYLFDIYLDYYDLFVPVSNNKYEFLIGFHESIPDTFRLGVPILKKFTSIFDIKGKTLTLASLTNKAIIKVEPPALYKSIEFTLMTPNSYLFTSVLAGKPQKEIMFSIDLGSPKTWVSQDSYNLESETLKNKSRDSFNNTIYDLEGINAQDTFEYGNVTLDSFDFLLAEKVHYVDSLNDKTYAALGLGKYKKEEENYNIITRLYKSNVGIYENKGRS
jgi:hypothetical protein